MRSQKDASDSLWASNSRLHRCCWIITEFKSLNKRRSWFGIFLPHNLYPYCLDVCLHWTNDKLPIDRCLLFGNKSYMFRVEVIVFQTNGPYISSTKILNTFTLQIYKLKYWFTNICTNNTNNRYYLSVNMSNIIKFNVV